MVYIFDTNSLRAIIINYYESCFPSFWDIFNEMINNDQIISAREVYRELENQGFIEWANRYKEIFKIPDLEDTNFIIKIFESKHFRNNLIEPKKIGDYKQIADPFLIAKAHNLKGCVVTEENKRPNSGKIPNICETFKIKCTNLKGFMEENNIRF